MIVEEVGSFALVEVALDEAECPEEGLAESVTCNFFLGALGKSREFDQASAYNGSEAWF